MVKGGIIVGIIIMASAIVGFVMIAPSALSGGNSHAPSAPLVSTVIIQEGAGLPDSGKGFNPATITVYIGVNNTVRWVNQDDTAHFIEADNTDSQWFSEATRLATDFSSKNVLEPSESFELTFEETGEFPYHSKPWNRGKVIVLS